MLHQLPQTDGLLHGELLPSQVHRLVPLALTLGPLHHLRRHTSRFGLLDRLDGQSRRHGPQERERQQRRALFGHGLDVIATKETSEATRREALRGGIAGPVSTVDRVEGDSTSRVGGGFASTRLR